MSLEIHNKEIKDECDALLNYFRFVRNATKDESFDLDNKLDHVIDYISKLECENLGLKEYKLHQERASERRYRSGGRVLAQRVSCRKEEVGGQNEQIKSKSNVE